MLGVRTALTALLGFTLVNHSVFAFNPLAKTNVVNYWGQNSVYFSGGQEASLGTYCQDSTVDVFAIGFVHQIVNGKPVLNLANHCETTFPGSNLLSCPQIGADIKACQAKGKAIVISIGGASGQYALDTPEQGTAFAQQIWDTFLGGSSSQRPFGDAVLDGVDLDLESGTNKGYAAFVQALRSKFASSSKPFYITAAPQCPYPDHALQASLNAAWFDLNVRILLGVPGGPGAAGSGIVNAAQLTKILDGVKSYSNFGGVMMWDAGVAAKSGLAAVAANYLHNSGPVTTTTTTSTRPTTTSAVTTTTVPPVTTTTTTVPTQTGGACNAPAWDAATAYSGGAVVSYNGRKYTAKWWTQGDVPSAAGSPWTDNGPCSGSTPTATPTPTPGGCSGVSAWNSSTSYSGGAKVSYEGYVYTAQWWTQGDTPGTNPVWVRGAACSGSSASKSKKAASVDANVKSLKRRLYMREKLMNKRR
ncbi:Chitinase 1 [Actinomortierella wolfii]|nr:Chitinase 1 [Actinomortierella wolfii]